MESQKKIVELLRFAERSVQDESKCLVEAKEAMNDIVVSARL